MENKKSYYLLSFSIALFLLSNCTEINQNISSAETSRDEVDETQPGDRSEEISALDVFISIFTDNENTAENSAKLSAAYLDSAANDLFIYPIDTLYKNPYGFEQDEIISYPDSVYRKRFANITSDIPLVYNRHIENFIDLYAIRKKDLTERMFGKSILYFPYIEKVLMEKNLPHDLKYLTMVESALQADAQSDMEAVGLWQIRYRTGKWLGLEINDYLDERRDPYTSTQAALTYLDRLHNIYGSWPMALAAYNSGPGNVNRAIVKARGSRDYWRVRKFLPSETKSYVPAFMALIYLNRFQNEHNIRPKLPEATFHAVDTVRVYHEISFSKLADDLKMKEEPLVFLNPALIKKKVPTLRNGWPLVIPIDKTAIFQENRSDLLLEDLPEEVAATAQVLKKRKEIVPLDTDLRLVEHKVLRGQTMDGIARRYRVNIRQIRDWNAMRDNIIRTGDTLNIYVPS